MFYIGPTYDTLVHPFSAVCRLFLVNNDHEDEMVSEIPLQNINFQSVEPENGDVTIAFY